MKMIRVVLRPEAVETVADGLAAAGFTSMTKIPVFGRGRQRGITLGAVQYDELPKSVLMIVVGDEDVEKVVSVIETGARTGRLGDGKIFVTPVDEAYTVRTGARGL